MALLNSSAQVFVVSLSLCFVWFILRKKMTPHRLPLPPGPKGLPLLGSALEINKDEPWLTYEQWKNAYGEIVSFKILGGTYIVLNSERVANALLDQRSNIYSDRPVVPTSVLFGVDFNTAQQPYGETWKSHRKMIHQTIGNAMVHNHDDSIAEKVRDLLASLLQSPEDFKHHMRTYAASIIMFITYGYNVLPKNDPFVEPLEEMIRILILMSPERAILFNVFPQLIKLSPMLPIFELQRLAVRCQKLSPTVREGPFQFVKQCLSKNVDNRSMVAQLLKTEILPQDRMAYEQDVKDCAMSMFVAGADTTQAALNTLILAMVLFPEVQDRAQAILDKVVGKYRLPNFNDKASLHYIDALLVETLRWGAIVPMSLPHMVTADDIFEQHLIPKGSIMIPNTWGMTRDEARFPDAEVFRPERYLDANGNLLPDDMSGICYGYGRRICAGQYLANASFWLAAANMLSVFRFSKAIGPTGYEIDVYPKLTSGIARYPVTFRCCIAPRSEEAKELLC